MAAMEKNLLSETSFIVSQSSLFQTITSCHFTCSSTEVILLVHSCFMWLLSLKMFTIFRRSAKHCAQHGIVGTLEVTRIHKQHPWRFSVWNTRYFCRICSILDIRTAPQQHWMMQVPSNSAIGISFLWETCCLLVFTGLLSSNRHKWVW